MTDTLVRPAFVALSGEQFLHPQRYRQAWLQAKDNLEGPIALEAASLYLEAVHGDVLQGYVSDLGEVLWNTIVADIAPTLLDACESLETSSLEARITPTVVQVVAQSVLTACRLCTPEVFETLHVAYHTLMDFVKDSKDDELTTLLEAFHDPIDRMDQLASPDVTSASIARVVKMQAKRAADLCKKLTVPVQQLVELTAVLAVAGDDAVKEVAGTVKQLDGAHAPNAKPQLIELFRPVRPQLRSSKAQWDDTLANTPEPYRSVLVLWGKHEDVVVGRRFNATESIKLMEAWAMHSVGRTLQELYTPEQMQHLSARLPVEMMVSAVLKFVLEYQSTPPDISWPQLRVSFVASSIVAVATPESTLAFAQELYEELHLHDEIPLLTATLQTHLVALTQVVQPFKANTPAH